MQQTETNNAQRIAHAACIYLGQRTGHAPSSVTVVLSECTLVITLHHALSPAELALAATPEGAAQVQKFHRKLFSIDLKAFCAEVLSITGVQVHDAIAQVDPDTGDIVHAFTSSNMVQVFQLKDHSSLASRRSTPALQPSLS